MDCEKEISLLKEKINTIFIKKPIMYLYNFSGKNIQVSIDFNNNIIADSVPAIRKDNKIVFDLDANSIINGKYDYLYYEFSINKDIRGQGQYLYIENNYKLKDHLSNLAKMVGLQGDEVETFVSYWNLELKRNDCKFFKCDIFLEEKLSNLFPITIDPIPEYLLRRYIKFIPIDKIGKNNISYESIKPSFRKGNLRIIEYGGWVLNDIKVK